MGALGTPTFSVVVVELDAPGPVTGTLMFTIADPRLARMLVPFPSFARADPDEKLNGALPELVALNEIVIIFPEFPVNPGFITIPSNEIDPVPAAGA